jgi:hypothetical protein
MDFREAACVSNEARNTAQQPQQEPSVRERQPETQKCILDSVGVVLAVIDPFAMGCCPER